MIQTIRIAKTTLTLTLGIMFLALAGGLVSLNQDGFRGRYGDWLRSEFADRGVHISFETLRFDLKRGLVATGVILYEDENHLRHLLKAEEMIVDLDKTKALRGEFKLYRLKISGGTTSIPVDKNRRMVTANEINGGLVITEGRRVVLKETSGLIEGIRVNLSADLKLPKFEAVGLEAKQQDALKLNHVLTLVLDELALWTFSPDAPPELTFNLEGDLNRSERLQTSFRLKAQNLSRNNYKLDNLIVAGDLQSEVITFDEIVIADKSGSLEGKADWSIHRRDGRFRIASTLQLRDFLENCFKPSDFEKFNFTALKDFHFTNPPLLKITGAFSAPINRPFSVHATGHGEIEKFRFRDSPFNKLSSNFSWKDGNLHLRDLEVSHEGGKLNGTLMSKDNLIRFDIKSTLPMKAFRPFIKPDSLLERSLQNVTLFENSLVEIFGEINKVDPAEWSARGKIHLGNLHYKGTRIHNLASRYSFQGGITDFSEVKGLLNDDHENARQRFKGMPSKEIRADMIRHDSRTRVTTISNLRGQVWPTPIIRIFAPKVAEHIEAEYRFHKRPQITLNGRFAGTWEDRDLTSFSVAARTEGQTDYPFLGYDLPLQDLKADIIVNGTKVTVKNLSAATLKGTVSGSVFCEITPGDRNSYNGQLKWDDLSFRSLSQVYKFTKEETGTLKGNIEFHGKSGGVRGFNAIGMAAINGGHLVSLPILGPLSPIIAGLLGDKRMGYERAKDAAAPFAVKRGIFQTKDFTAVSTNMILTGEGWVDLLTEDMDLVVRVNARGLLGFLTLPLQPLKGIFQFRGDGSFTKPNWKSSPFTRPSKGKDDPIFQQPGKAIRVPE